MSILEKIGRVLLWPTEVRLMAQNARWERENNDAVKKANQIMLDLKKAIQNDPDIQGFLKEYDAKYVNGPMKMY
ncbi:MAG: hypothetical protein LCH52_10135 [Bacteroidetes bacterium]|nr:hypothetical protein [Bacteroidota bacterium]